MEDEVNPEEQLPVRLVEANQTAAQLQWKVARQIEKAINDEYAGCEMQSSRSKRAMIAHIRNLLRQHALKAICPQCGRAADVYFSSTQGSIRFRHTTVGRKQNHGGRVRLGTIATVPVAAVDQNGQLVIPEDNHLE